MGLKVEEVKKMFLLFLPKATKHGTFQGPPNLEPSKGHQIYNFPSATKQDVSPLTSKYWIHFKGHQAWNTLRATKHGTFHWPSNWGLPPPPSFPFSLKA